MKKPTKMIILMIYITIFITFCSKSGNIQNKFQSIPKSNSQVPVIYTLAKYSDLEQTITAPANLLAYHRGDLTVQLSGRVKTVDVYEGDHVTAGDTLVIIDKELVQIALARARGDFFKAVTEFLAELKVTDQNNYKEWNTWFHKATKESILPPMPDSLSQSRMIAIVRYNLHQYFARVKESEEHLRRCTIIAPFDGTVSDIRIYPSAAISSGKTLLTLTDLSRLRVEIEFPDQDLNFIRPGTGFQFVSYPTDTFTVTAIHPQIDDKTHTGKALAVIPNRYRFKDGQRVMTSVTKQIYAQRLTVPREAVLTRNDRDLVFVVENGIAMWRYVTLGVGNENKIEIIEGITAGDTVIVGGHYSLAHDVPVRLDKIRK